MTTIFVFLAVTFLVAGYAFFMVACHSNYASGRLFMASGISFVGLIITAPIAFHLVSERNAAAFDRALSSLKPIPASVLFWANPRATAALMGPVENGTALGCFKRKGSFSHGWIPADFMVHSDLSIAMAPRPRIANGSMSDGAVRYEGDNKAIVDACKAAEVSASQSL